VLLLALVVFGVTAWFFGVRLGGIAAGISAATIIAAQVIPGTAVAIYALHVLWVGGLAYLGPKLAKLRKPPPRAGWRGDANRLLRRGLALWKFRK
jgi:hypothetical protein